MILVYLENNLTNLPKSTLSAISAAKELKKTHNYNKVVGLVLGLKGLEEATEKAAKYGLDEIIFCKSEVLDNYLALNYTAAIKQIIELFTPKVFLCAATTLGKDLAPRIAQSLNAGQASDIIGILANSQFRRLMYAGNIVADIELTTENKVVTVRTTAFDMPAEESTSSPIKEIPLRMTADPRQTFITFDTVKSERPELSEAEIVISGGRALKSEENFQKFIIPLADKLGAAVGASRAAVDSGYAPNDWQVGQTGKVVAPKLYVAIGISGAIQHLAGMKDSKVIVAINKDPEAPIFEIADYGLVADLFEAVPELIEQIKN